jgi:iron complex transport system substrate-binding protein
MRTRPSRRLRIAALTTAALVASGLLAGCGDDSEAADSPAASDEVAEASALMPAAEGQVEYPVTLETAWGEVTIEERPERVVAGSWRGDLSWLLALGVTPVAVESAEWAVESAVPWAADLLAEPIEHTWTYEDVALEPEPIAASQPDLIVAGALGAEPVPNLDQLGAVAPVLAQPAGEEVVSWQENLLQLGEALDLQDKAQQVVDDYESFFEDFRAEHTAFADTSIAYVEFFGKNDIWFGNPDGSAVGDFYDRLGFASNPSDVTDEEAISPELLGRIEGDVLMVVDYSDPKDEGKEFGELVDSPLFQSIPAVQAGRVVYLSNPDRSALFQDGVEVGKVAHPSVAYDDPIGSPQFADLLAPLLEEALAG